MTSFRIRSAAAAFLVFGLAAAGPVKAEVLTAAQWTESSTDASGNYSATPGATQNGSGVSGPIQTDANQASPDFEVTNYLRTGSDLGLSGGGNAALLGNLSGYSNLSATFNISNSTLAAGVQFTSSEIVGETTPPGSPGSPTNSALRLVFTGATPLAGGTPNEWWFDPNPAVVTSMLNGQDVTLDASFDPSLWSNYNGIVGDSSPDATAQFEAALSDVSRLGLSFGSGNFFSDGFAFDTGGTASINLDSVSATTPEPSTWVLFAGSGLVLFLVRRRRAIA